MDAGYIFIATGCISAFGASLLIWLAFTDAFLGRSRIMRVQQRAASRSSFALFETGFHSFNRVAEHLLGFEPIRHFARQLALACTEHNLSASPIGILSVLIAVSMCVLGVSVFAGRLALGILAIVACVFSCGAWAAFVEEKRIQNMRDALPDAFLSMNSCFGAGYSLVQTFSHLEEELSGPLARLFGRAASELKTGLAPQTVLAHMRDEGGMRELSFVAVALAVQRQTGGSIAHVLGATRDALKEEIELQQSLRVQTAQAHLSARVVVGVTLALVASMMLLSKDFLSPFLSSAFGMALLVLAIGMQVVGIIMVRRFLHVDVV